MGQVVEPGRSDDGIIRRMPIACWITEASNTYLEYVVLIVLPLQQWLHERASLLRYTYIACLVSIIWISSSASSSVKSFLRYDHSLSRDPLMESTCYFMDALHPDLHNIIGTTLLNNSFIKVCLLYCNRNVVYIISDSYDLCSLAE